MFHTSNLYLAAVLVCMGNKLNDIDATNPARAVFYFENMERAKADNDLYWAGKVELNAKELFDTISSLKTKIHQKKV